MPTFVGTPTPGGLSAYALETARTELKRATPWLTQDVSFAPMTGLADGANTILHLPMTPADDTSAVTIYDSTGAEITNWSVVSYESGAVRFSAGSIPAAVPYASYTALGMPGSKLLNLCYGGFDEMQSRYRRDYYIVPSGNYHYISSSESEVVDPVCGSRTFSTSRAQVDLLLACCEYRLLRALQTEAAINNFAYREERVGGLMVDRTRQAPVYDPMIAEINQRIAEKLEAAREESGDTSAFGSFIPGARSDTYASGYDWWSDSEQARGV